MKQLRVCLNPPQRASERAEGNEAVRGHSFRSYVKEGAWVHAESWAPPAESARTASFAHTTAKLVSTYIFGGVYLHQNNLVFVFPFGRAVFGPPKQEKSVQHFVFFFLDIYCFSRAALNLYIFVSHNQSTPIQAANIIPFGSF